MKIQNTKRKYNTQYKGTQLTTSTNNKLTWTSWGSIENNYLIQTLEEEAWIL